MGYNSNLDENFNKLANSFRFYDTNLFFIWIKDAVGIKSEHQNEEGTKKKTNVFHNMWRLLNSMEMGTNYLQDYIEFSISNVLDNGNGNIIN